MGVRLFVLGVIYLKDVHGYEIKEVAQRWGIERWARIRFGSIYHALGKLEEEKLVIELCLEQDGARPPRTVYRITEEGEHVFLQLLRDTCRTADPETRDLDIALAFIDQLPPEERVALLTDCLAGLEPRYTELMRVIATYERARRTPPSEVGDTPELAEARRILLEVPWVEAGVRHSLGRVVFEREWLQSVLHTVADWPRRPRSKRTINDPAPSETRTNA